MNDFCIHLKYSFKMFRYLFIFLIFIGLIFGISLAVLRSSYYHEWYIEYVSTSPVIDPQVVEQLRAGSSISYWREFILYMAFIASPAIAFFISRDEENGINGMLIIHSKKGSLLISRLVIIILTFFIVSLIAGLIFTFLFYQINRVVLNQIPLSLGVFLILSSFGLIGAFLGVIVPKREWAVIITIFIVIFLIMLSDIGISEGNTYVDKITEGEPITWDEYISLYPLKWKILRFISPWGLAEMLNPLAGIPQGGMNPNPTDVSLLGLKGDIILSLVWVFLLSSFACLIFFRKHRNSLEVTP